MIRGLRGFVEWRREEGAEHDDGGCGYGVLQTALTDVERDGLGIPLVARCATAKWILAMLIALSNSQFRHRKRIESEEPGGGNTSLTR